MSTSNGRKPSGGPVIHRGTRLYEIILVEGDVCVPTTSVCHEVTDYYSDTKRLIVPYLCSGQTPYQGMKLARLRQFNQVSGGGFSLVTVEEHLADDAAHFVRCLQRRERRQTRKRERMKELVQELGGEG